MCCIVKYGLFIVNTIFCLFGLCLLGLGTAVLVSFQDVATVIPINTNGVPISLIVIGSLIFLTAFFGCCGAVAENKCFLAMYAVIMLLLAAGKTYIAVVVFRALGNIYDTVIDWLGQAFNNKEMREEYHIMEASFKCCGTTGPKSYDGILEQLPPTCCPEPDDNYTCDIKDAFDGCNELIGSFFNSYGTAIGWLVVLVILIEIVLAIFSICVCQTIRNKRK